MDYDKLIERLRKEAYGSDIEELLLEAATALSTLQTENNGLKEKLYDGEGVNLVDYWMQQAKIEENGHRNCRAENEKLRDELEAARAALAELTGLADGSVQTLFGVPLERMQELAQAELEGRVMLRSAGAGKKCGSCGHWHRIHDTRRGTCDVRRWLRDRYGASEPGTAFIPTQSYGACRDYIPGEDDNHG